MSRTATAAVLAGTMLAGLALITAGACLGELSELTADAPLQALLVYATVGVWAQTRGLVTTRTWLTRPDRLVRALVARIGGAR